jgi:hypothetical protein
VEEDIKDSIALDRANVNTNIAGFGNRGNYQGRGNYRSRGRRGRRSGRNFEGNYNLEGICKAKANKYLFCFNKGH